MTGTESGHYMHSVWLAPGKTFRRYGMDDRSFRRIVARYLRIFGGACDSFGWHTVQISRVWCRIPGIVPCDRPTVIDAFSSESDAVSEFVRLYAR